MQVLGIGVVGGKGIGDTVVVREVVLLEDDGAGVVVNVEVVCTSVLDEVGLVL